MMFMPLLARASLALAAELRSRIAAIEGLRGADLHVWRIGPEARAAIVEVEGALSAAELRTRLGDLGSIAHLTIAVR